MLLALLANVHRGQNEPAKTPQDFMPYIEREPEDISEEEFRAKVLTHFARLPTT